MAAIEDNDDSTQFNDLFQEPAEFLYKPEPKPTFATYTQLNGEDITLRLVGHSILWGHLLWNAGRTISRYIEERTQQLTAGRTVLELGAGAGLPSIICALNGAAAVVVTDYPDDNLVANLKHNVDQCVPASTSVFVEPYCWGKDVEPIRAHLPKGQEHEGFDVLILGDLLFNHSEHKKLIWAVQKTMKRSHEATALVFFTPYRPWLLAKDLAFFDLARDGGFKVEKILEKVMDKVMFDEDPGDELLRRTVFGYSLTWADPINT